MIYSKFSRIIIDKIYQETLSLLYRTESFLKAYKNEGNSRRDQLLDLRINCELTRISARLTRVMAWLLAQKAACEGELDSEEANSIKYRVLRDPFCLKNSLQGQEKLLPPNVKALLIDSLSLYERALILCENSIPTSSDQTPESES